MSKFADILVKTEKTYDNWVDSLNKSFTYLARKAIKSWLKDKPNIKAVMYYDIMGHSGFLVIHRDKKYDVKPGLFKHPRLGTMTPPCCYGPDHVHRFDAFFDGLIELTNFDCDLSNIEHNLGLKELSEEWIYNDRYLSDR